MKYRNGISSNSLHTLELILIVIRWCVRWNVKTWCLLCHIYSSWRFQPHLCLRFDVSGRKTGYPSVGLDFRE